MLDSDILRQTPSMTSIRASVSSSSSTTGKESVVTVSGEKRQQETLEQLTAELSKYARANDRRMILRSLNRVKTWLTYVPLEPMRPSILTMEHLETEALEEIIVLNGVSFKPYGISASGKPRSNAHSLSERNALVMLRGLCNELCRDTDSSPEWLYILLLWRVAKTTASAEARARLAAFFGGALDVNPISSSTAAAAAAAVAAIRLPIGLPGEQAPAPVKPSAPAPKVNHDYPPHRNSHVLSPIELSVYVDRTNGSVHMTSTSSFSFGLFRKSDNRPWIALSVNVRERTNLTAQTSVRSMDVQVPDLY